MAPQPYRRDILRATPASHGVTSCRLRSEATHTCGAHRPRGSSQLVTEPTRASSHLPHVHSSCHLHQHASHLPSASSASKLTLLMQPLPWHAAWGPSRWGSTLASPVSLDPVHPAAAVGMSSSLPPPHMPWSRRPSPWACSTLTVSLPRADCRTRTTGPCPQECPP